MPLAIVDLRVSLYQGDLLHRYYQFLEHDDADGYRTRLTDFRELLRS